MTAVKKEGSEVTYYIPEKKLNVEFASEDKNTKVDTVFNDKTVKDNKVTLKPGSNILNIVAAPETSAEPTRYAVNIKDPDSTNANRESVVFSDNVKSDKKFEKTTTEYTGIATSFTTTIDVEAEEKDAMVKVTVNGKEQKELKKVKLVEGDNTIVIEVTSPDKRKNLYIRVRRKECYLSF
ncbi:MAG: cadherin-like beta sandwich domain-containing protein [[Clostridium] nexile]